jgi:nitrite reductase/ring-hydroxylating ferredoxin subunit/uncharacterized membrane protein
MLALLLGDAGCRLVFGQRGRREAAGGARLVTTRDVRVRRVCMKLLPPLGNIDRLENAAFLDPVANSLRNLADTIIQPRALRDVLHGVPIGHPVHPVAVQVPIGAWVSATILDFIPGQQRAAGILAATGVVTALPAVLSGYADWSQLHEQQLRVGVVHAASNAVATSCYVISLRHRVRGRRVRGRAWALAGLSAAGVGGFLGGHLAYRQASGANHVEDVPHRVSPGWHDIAGLDELGQGRLEKRMLGEVPLVLLRRGEQVDVLAGLCSHLSGPLEEGSIVEEDGGTCVVCPWHQSTFSLRTGEVVHGPATSPQPRFQTRVVAGRVQVCLPNAG